VERLWTLQRIAENECVSQYSAPQLKWHMVSPRTVHRGKAPCTLGSPLTYTSLLWPCSRLDFHDMTFKYASLCSSFGS
jgi:hypothetical protein